MSNRGRPPEQANSRPVWARRIRDARRSLGMTQAVVAKKLGISQRQVSDWEGGHRSVPDFAEISRLAAALGVTLNWIASDPAREPAESYRRARDIIARHEQDETFKTTLVKVSAMLCNEGVDADLEFLIRLTFRLWQQAHGGSKHIPIGKRIEAAVLAERVQLREGMIRL